MLGYGMLCVYSLFFLLCYVILCYVTLHYILLHTYDMHTVYMLYPINLCWQQSGCQATPQPAEKMLLESQSLEPHTWGNLGSQLGLEMGMPFGSQTSTCQLKILYKRYFNWKTSNIHLQLR